MKDTELIDSIDAYIATFPKPVQAALQQLRQVIKEAAPEAGETIKYRMPTFTYHGNLVHFAAYQHHIGFYPAPEGIEQFAAELASYPQSKGAIRFPIDKPLPYDLIFRITQFRAEQNAAKVADKRKRGRAKARKDG